MPRRQIRVVRRTPPGEPDKPINLLTLLGSVLGIVVVVSGALFSVIGDRIRNAEAETREVLRAETAAKMDAARTQMWQQFQQYYSRTEIDARRVELDRRYDETKAWMTRQEAENAAQTVTLERIKAQQDLETQMHQRTTR